MCGNLGLLLVGDEIKQPHEALHAMAQVVSMRGAQSYGFVGGGVETTRMFFFPGRSQRRGRAVRGGARRASSVAAWTQRHRARSDERDAKIPQVASTGGKMLVHKAVLPKRADIASRLARAFRRRVDVRKRPLLVSAHLRFATSSRSLSREAHPHSSGR